MRENGGPDISSRRFSTSEFDCTPPEEAIDELLRPKRRTYRPPPTPTLFARVDKLIRWGIGFSFIAVLLSLAGYLSEKRSSAVPPAPVIVRPTPIPRSPRLAPVAPAPPTRWAEETPAPVPVRRAELVLPEVRRATLVDLPVGYRLDVTMPDGTPLNARYMGTVSNFSQLPRNPSPNDLWRVTASGNSWIWYTPAGFSGPAWVDP